MSVATPIARARLLGPDLKTVPSETKQLAWLSDEEADIPTWAVLWIACMQAIGSDLLVEDGPDVEPTLIHREEIDVQLPERRRRAAKLIAALDRLDGARAEVVAIVARRMPMLEEVR